MESTPPPLVGFNNNVRYRGMRFHIQTEDSGVTRPHIITHLFADGGHVIKSVRTDYSDLVSHPERPTLIHKLMRDQHRAMALDLRDGRLDPTIDELARYSIPASDRSEAAPEAAAPARDRLGTALDGHRPPGVAHSNLPADGPLALASEAPPPGTRRSARLSEPPPGTSAEQQGTAPRESPRAPSLARERPDTSSGPVTAVSGVASSGPAMAIAAAPEHSGGVAPASDGVAPASDGAAPASDGVAPASDGVAPASGGAASTRGGAASTRGGAASARGSRPPPSDGRPPASSKGRARTPKKKRGRPSSAPPQTPRSQGGTRRAGRPSAALPSKPSGESIFGATPQESLDDAILSYVSHAKNGPPTRGSK
jgi:hypothetical protein